MPGLSLPCGLMQLLLHAEERKKDLLLLEQGTADAGVGRALKALIPKAVDADDEDEPESDSSSDNDDDEVRAAAAGQLMHAWLVCCMAWCGTACMHRGISALCMGRTASACVHRSGPCFVKGDPAKASSCVPHCCVLHACKAEPMFRMG